MAKQIKSDYPKAFTIKQYRKISINQNKNQYQKSVKEALSGGREGGLKKSQPGKPG